MSSISRKLLPETVDESKSTPTSSCWGRREEGYYISPEGEGNADTHIKSNRRGRHHFASTSIKSSTIKDAHLNEDTILTKGGTSTACTRLDVRHNEANVVRPECDSNFSPSVVVV